MCGILGIHNFKATKPTPAFKKEQFRDALQLLKHRGPDAQDVIFLDDEIALGHARLSIIDLRELNNQPFVVDDRYYLVFNGEIYNYLEIRDELISEGFGFVTNGDTEVLIKSYMRWGEDCVKKFNGMWAFALYDRQEQKLFCSRDRFGVKPFNYSIVEGSFIFSSEIKSIIHYFSELAEPDYNIIANFCRTTVGAQQAQTWFKNIFRLLPATNLVIDKGTISTYKYWHYPTKINNNINKEEAHSRYKELFIDAVKIRMRSDVPVGTTLSSGLDSTSIVSTLRLFFKEPHNTYTAIFDENSYTKTEKLNYKDKNTIISEKKLLDGFVDDMDLTAKFIEPSFTNFLPNLKKIIYHLESGNSSPAVFALDEILEEVQKDVTVFLEGQGADEMLGGYLTFCYVYSALDYLKEGKFVALYQHTKSFREYYSLKRAIIFWLRSKVNVWPVLSRIRLSLFSPKIYGKNLSSYTFVRDYPDQLPSSGSHLTDELMRQHNGLLGNLLHYGDALSMKHSLESRLPFMDYRLVEYSFALPHHFKCYDGKGKVIHRNIMEGILPDSIRLNKMKYGFSTPISNLLRQQEVIDYIIAQQPYMEHVFNEQELKNIVLEHQTRKKDHASLLFRVLSVKVWFELFIAPVGIKDNIKGKPPLKTYIF